MSMDDQYRELQRFRAVLYDFNQHLGNSWRDLQQQHEQVQAGWQDEMRRMYDRSWEPLAKTMEAYQQTYARKYVEFLDKKIRATRGYLYGG